MIHVFREEAQEYIDMGAINGLFVLGRSIGFIGHFMDQKRLKQGLYRHPWDDISYVVSKMIDGGCDFFTYNNFGFFCSYRSNTMLKQPFHLASSSGITSSLNTRSTFQNYFNTHAIPYLSRHTDHKKVKACS